MFKVPDWEDIPKNNLSFDKNVKNQQKPPIKNTPVKRAKIKRIPKPHSMLPTKNDMNIKSKKRKHYDKIKSANINMKKEIKSDNNLEIQNFDTDLLDEVVINAKKKKINQSFENDDNEEVLFRESKEKKVKKNSTKNNIPNTNMNKNVNSKKEKIKKILQTQSNRNHINVGNGKKLRERMLERLKAAQFRYLNEKLYTSSGTEAQQLFQGDPAAFQTYHQGYQQQLKKWPVNPLDVIVKRIQKMPKSHIIADMGCGEAALSKRLAHKVRSFDLVASSPSVEACDMAHTPLLKGSVDVVVYCLALMGTDLTQYLVEANRVLKMSGHLLISEVESRFENVDTFIKDVQRLGFKLNKLDKSHKVFFFIEFTKIQDPPAKKSKLPVLNLKPCLYKRR